MKITFYYAPKNGLDEKLKVYNDLLGKLRNAAMRMNMIVYAVM